MPGFMKLTRTVKTAIATNVKAQLDPLDADGQRYFLTCVLSSLTAENIQRPNVNAWIAELYDMLVLSRDLYVVGKHGRIIEEVRAARERLDEEIEMLKPTINHPGDLRR